MKTVLAFVIVLFALSRADVARGQDFTLINRIGLDIHSIFVTPHGTNDWEEDILARDMLFPNQAAGIRMDRGTQTREWDVKAVDKLGREYIWENLNLLEIAKVTLELKDGQTSAELE